MRRTKRGAVRGGKPGNELKGKDVVDEPMAGKRKRGRPGKYTNVNDDDLKANAMALADGRTDLSKKDQAMYKELRNRGLLDQTWPMKKRGRKTLKTPDFIFKFCPDAPKKLPIEAVKRLNELLKEGEENKYGDFISDKHKRAIYFWVNNFSYKITHLIPHEMPEKERKTKIGELYKNEKTVWSNLMKSQTSEEFLETVKKVMEECGLSYEKAGELSMTIKGSLYVLPAFLKLLEMGYKDYPDLSA